MLNSRPFEIISAGAAALVLLGACASRTDAPATRASARRAPAAAAPASRPSAPASAPVATRPAATGHAALVQGLPEVLACTPTPRPTLMGSGPGQELFSVLCSNGYGLLVQCTAGHCKVMN